MCAGLMYYMAIHVENSLSAQTPLAIERVKTENDVEKLKELVVVGTETLDSTNKNLVGMHKSYALALLGVAVFFSVNIFSIYSYIKKTASNKSLNSDAEKRRAS